MNPHRPTSAAPATGDHVAARASTARTGADAALTATARWPWTIPMNWCSATRLSGCSAGPSSPSPARHETGNRDVPAADPPDPSGEGARGRPPDALRPRPPILTFLGGRPAGRAFRRRLPTLSTRPKAARDTGHLPVEWTSTNCDAVGKPTRRWPALDRSRRCVLAGRTADA